MAGDKAIEKYKKIYSDEEAQHWIQYKTSDGTKCYLEKILSKTDQKRLLEITGVQDLKKAITTLYFSDKKSEFWAAIDIETYKNIESNLATIRSVLHYRGEYMFNYRFNIAKQPIALKTPKLKVK